MVNRILKGLGLACVAVALSSIPAHATPEQDDWFNHLLREAGMEPLSRSSEVAQLLCDYIEAGYSPDELATHVYGQNDISPEDAREFVGLAAMVYCPPVQERKIHAAL